MAIFLVSKFCLQITLLQDLAVGDVPLARAPGTGFSIYPVPAAKKKSVTLIRTWLLPSIFVTFSLLACGRLRLPLACWYFSSASFPPLSRRWTWQLVGYSWLHVYGLLTFNYLIRQLEAVIPFSSSHELRPSVTNTAHFPRFLCCFPRLDFKFSRMMLDRLDSWVF